MLMFALISGAISELPLPDVTVELSPNIWMLNDALLKLVPFRTPAPTPVMSNSTMSALEGVVSPKLRTRTHPTAATSAAPSFDFYGPTPLKRTTAAATSMGCTEQPCQLLKSVYFLDEACPHRPLNRPKG